MGKDCWVVIPCYDEAERLDIQRFLRFLKAHPQGYRLLFVNDGSSDGTEQLLERLVRDSADRFQKLSLPQNRGKGEAVRRGILWCLERDPWSVGYWDADLATPLELLLEFKAILREHSEVEVVLGSRVRLLGREIRTSAFRHYGGRLFAAFVSLALGLPVYDTQCGAKLIRVTEHTEPVFNKPFASRWIFDVEMLSRYLLRLQTPQAKFYEHPLDSWEDVEGSKIGPSDLLRSVYDLGRLYWVNLRHLH